jgi:hypothetical protein
VPVGPKHIQPRTVQAVISLPDIALPQGPKWIFAKTIVEREDNKMAAVLLEKKEHELWVVLTVMVNFQKR